MNKKIIKFDNTETEKYEFYQRKSPTSIYNIDINKTVISNKVHFGKKDFKCLIDYKDAKKNRPLCTFLPKISACRINVDETKNMPFLIKNDEILQKFNEIWEKLSNSIKNEFNSEPVYNKKNLITKIKSYKRKP